MEKNERVRVKCPKCGYLMPQFYERNANCKGVFLACKGRQCSNIFELKIEKGVQIK